MKEDTAPAPSGFRTLGTGAHDLIEPCGTSVRAARPVPPPCEPAFAVALSGGGFRATLAGLGVLRFLADAGLLGQVRWASSVSGGSVANGLFAVTYSALRTAEFAVEEVDRLLVLPIVRKISSRSLTRKLALNLWRAAGRQTRTDVLAWAFDDWWFKGVELESITRDVRFVFNAANATTGVRFGFERDVVGDYVVGLTPTRGTGLRVAQAAAASAAVPGAFAAMKLPGIAFPCANGRTTRLLDGGVYDNLGLETVDDLVAASRNSLFEATRAGASAHEDPCLVALNAGGVLRTGYGGIPLVRDLQRAEGLLYRQSTALRMRTMVERFQAWERSAPNERPGFARRGVLFGLATTFPAERVDKEWVTLNPEFPERRLELLGVKTSFARFPHSVCEKLIYRGWWLTGAALAAFHRSLLPAQLPRWRALTD